MHDFVDDPRNADVLIHVNGSLVPRDRAVVSVFDAWLVLTPEGESVVAETRSAYERLYDARLVL